MTSKKQTRTAGKPSKNVAGGAEKVEFHAEEPGGTGRAEAGKSDKTREAAVLAAAYAVFTRYGFERVTMDDVAREAGVARPLLYRNFRNKRDIYRALAARMATGMTDALEQALQAEGPAGDVLWEAWRKALIEPLAAIAETPHGMALIDMKSDLANDVMADMRSRKRMVLIRFFHRYMAGQGPLGASALADVLIDAFEGAKARTTDIGELGAAAKAAILLVAETIDRSKL
jgi:AcrR family transcriptional regulator